METQQGQVSQNDQRDIPDHAHGKQGIHSLLCFTCMSSFCFPYGTVFVPADEFSAFYLSNAFSNLIDGGVRDHLCGAWLLAGVKPQHS